jgi:type IV secretion system protein VirB4
VFTTQSLTELSESEIFPLLVDNIKTKLLLANDKVEVHRDLYRNRFLLNDEQIARIATLIPKQQYYIVNDYGSRVVNARLPERIMATIKSDKASLGRLFALKEKAAPGWEFDFIEEQMRYA